MTGNRDYRLAPIWRALMSELGINPADVLRLAGLPEDLLLQPEVRASADEFFALWRAAESLLPHLELPVEVAQRTAAETFTPELFATLCSPNLIVALDRLATYKQLCAPIRVELTVGTDESMTATLHWIDAETPPPASLTTVELALIVRIARMGTRREVGPTHVSLPALPDHIEPYEAYFGTTVQTAARGSVTFSRDTLQTPFLTSSEELWKVFEPDLRRRLASLQAGSTTAERVRAVLLESLPSGRANIGDVATRLGVSARTLQRRLRSEGAGFGGVLAEVRQQLARHYLAQTDLPCNEIAFLLGYDEPNSFFRAFQGWTGLSPERHRRALS